MHYGQDILVADRPKQKKRNEGVQVHKYFKTPAIACEGKPWFHWIPRNKQRLHQGVPLTPQNPLCHPGTLISASRYKGGRYERQRRRGFSHPCELTLYSHFHLTSSTPLLMFFFFLSFLFFFSHSRVPRLSQRRRGRNEIFLGSFSYPSLLGGSHPAIGVSGPSCVPVYPSF